MSGSMPCEKISPTAKVVAFLRSFTDIPYTRALSDKSNAEEAAREIFKKHNVELDDFLWLVPVIEARHKSIENLLRVLYITLEQDYGDIVVDLASGFSPTGMIFSRDPKINYLEVDLPDVIEEKRAIVRDIISVKSRPNLQFVSANILDDSCFEEIEKKLSAGPVALICEGLLPYFNCEEKNILTKNIRYLLMKRGGTWITPDISSKERIKMILQTDPNLAKVLDFFSGMSHCNIEANSFATLDDARTFFRGNGFKITEWKQCEIVPKLRSLSLLSDTEIKNIKAMLERGYIWTMELF